jgi:hypothetical protein
VTLVVNEVHYDPKAPSEAVYVCAADRRITDWETGKPIGSRVKIFAVDGILATVSYFGLTDYKLDRTFEDFLEGLKCQGRWTSLGSFALWLTGQLNAIVEKSWLRDRPSGFHVAGFSRSAIPEMWFITNIGGLEGYRYASLRTHYEVSERLRVDIKGAFCPFAGNFLHRIGYAHANGDLRAFNGAWGGLMQMERDLREALGDSKILTANDRANALQWKLDTVSEYYRHLTSKALIGKPIDVFIVTPSTVQRRHRGLLKALGVSRP